MIYLDNASTSKPSREVISLYELIEANNFGNSGSIHHIGMEADALLEKARSSILKSFGLSSHRVIFTSGSTEALNLAIKGYCLSHKNRGNHIITTNIEHPAVLECFKQLADEFHFEVEILPVSNAGVLSPDTLANAVKDDTILVAAMSLNNEIGSQNDVDALASIVHKYPKAVFLSDTTQSLGKESLNYANFDMFVVSAHKINGLKGSGCLLVKKSISLLPLISGGGQEDGFRSGTVSVAHACALSKAIQTAIKNQNENLVKVAALNALLREGLSKRDDIVINSDISCSPYILNFSLKNKRASVVVEALSNRDIFVSSLSACHSKKQSSSYVVKALGKDEQLSHNTIRVSFSPENTSEDVGCFLMAFDEIMRSIR